uniref:Homer 2 n=1 Tax=Anthurium amnicola TaxID=1678845 RepID=A0A1D1XNK6_9ARAE
MAAASSSSGGALDSVASEDRRMDGSVWKAEQTYLTIGMGAGLLFLLTRSVTEFNKMTQLREEMEVLLKGIKDAMRGKDASPSSDESKNNVTFCGSDSRPDTELSNDLSMRDCYPRLELVETTCDAESPGMDEMEAELESELELLQLNLIEQDSSGQRGVEFSGERTDSSESFSVCLGEHYEPKKGAEQDEEEETRDQYGVCPHELTTRLHELVEKRQQERISELESALELVHVKLREKETEVCWWRDAAEFVSQNNQGTLLG